MFWLRLSGWLFVLIVLATAAVMFLGNRLPPTHTTTLSAILPTTPDRLWPLLTTPEAQPRWRADLTATDPLPDQNSLPCWVEHHDRSATPVCITQISPRTSFTLHTSEPRQPIQSERRFLLVPATPSTTRVTLSETVTIAPPMLRFYDHYIVGEQTTAAHLLADLNSTSQSPSSPPPSTP